MATDRRGGHGGFHDDRVGRVRILSTDTTGFAGTRDHHSAAQSGAGDRRSHDSTTDFDSTH